jgi:TolA-binding protein
MNKKSFITWLKVDDRSTEVEKVEPCLGLRLEELQSEVGNLRHEIESLNEKLKKAEQVKLKEC